MDKINLEHNEIIKRKEFEDFKLTFDNKSKAVENAFFEAQKIKQDNENIAEALEKLSLGLQKNEEDIANIGITIGHDKLKRISDYENKLYSILEVLDKMAYELANIKEKLGLKTNNNSEQVFIPVVPPKSVVASPPVSIIKSTDKPIIEIEENTGKDNKPKSENVEIKNIVKEIDKKAEETKKIDDIKTKDIGSLDYNKLISKVSNKPTIQQSQNSSQTVSKSEVLPSLRKQPFLEDKSQGYIDISKNNKLIPTENRASKEKLDNEREINDLLLSGGYYLVRKDLVNAVNIYRELSNTYNPDYDKNSSTYYKIMAFYDNIIKLRDSTTIKNEKESETIVSFGEKPNKNKGWIKSTNTGFE
jgi:hypothetical protein